MKVQLRRPSHLTLSNIVGQNLRICNKVALLHPAPTIEMLKLLSFEKNDELEEVTVWTEDLVKNCLNLFLTLLPFNHNMDHTLCEVYIVTTIDVKRIILRQLEGAIRQLGLESVELLQVVEACARGSETLVTRIIYVLTENSEFIVMGWAQQF